MGELDRVRWHCRRGLLELDLTLTRFVDQHYAALTASQKAAFAALLDRPDGELWDLISGRAEPEPGEIGALVRYLRGG